jgi:lauroyl/myristoyl acyltransferase
MDQSGGTARATELQDGAFASGDAFWAAYRGACFVALAQPVSAIEQDRLGPIAQRMGDYLGLSPEAAAYQARRALFCYRQEWIHSEMALELPPAAITTLVDSVEVEGRLWLERTEQARGLLLTSLHYSLYSSLLWLWLVQATGRGLFRRLTIMMVADRPALGARTTRQIQRLEAAGLLAPGAVTVIERSRSVALAPAVVRTLLSRLRAGETVYFCAEPYFVDPTDRHAAVLTLGPAALGLPGGVPWLARAAQCPVVTLHIHPGLDDRYVVSCNPPAAPDPPGGAGQGVVAALQQLLDQTVRVDPAHWEGWVWIRPAQAGDSLDPGPVQATDSPDSGRAEGTPVMTGAVGNNR